MEKETERNGDLFCSYWLLSVLSATYTTVSTGVENLKWEMSVKSLLWQNFCTVSCYCDLYLSKTVWSWTLCGQLKGRQRNGISRVPQIISSLEPSNWPMPFICTADCQCSQQNFAALYTTVCSTTATVPTTPDWCCSLYNSLQYYHHCSFPTTLVLLSIQLSAVLQLLYLPHQNGAALYTTLCSTTATVPAPPHWFCSLYNSLQYYRYCTCSTPHLSVVFQSPHLPHVLWHTVYCPAPQLI